MSRLRYPEYKPSGVEWLGEVPGHWEVKRLKFAAACINDKQDELSDGSGYVAMEHIESWTGKRLDIENGITPESQTSRFQKDDVLFGKLRPYLAKSWLADRDGACSTELLVLRGRELDPAYLRYWTLMRPFVEIVDGSTYGSKMPRANWDFIGSMLTSIPARDEQRAIAAFLDGETARIDALIEKKRRFIELLQEKRAALISRAVTRGLDSNVPLKDSGVEWLGQIPAHWDAKRLKFLCPHIRSGKTPKGGGEVYVHEGVMLIRSQNVYNDGLRLDDVVFIEEEIDAEMASTRVLPGDVLLNITGASIGRCSVVPQDCVRANVNQHVCAIRTRSEKLNPEFLQLYMISNPVQALIFSNENGTSREGLTFEQIGNMVLSLPPLKEQERIVSLLSERVATIDSLFRKVESAIERLKEYRTALIAAAVTGKIDVRAA